MVSMTSAPAAPHVWLPEDAQRPRIHLAPAYEASAGLEAVQAYELTGQELDDWQQLVLIDASGERPDGRWAAFEIGLEIARQNGKDEILAARELAGLFAWGERLLIHSAHKFDTAMEHLERLVDLISGTPEFSRRVHKVNRSHGSEGITLRSGARIRFRARTRSGGARGYTGDCVIFNEAMDLPDALVGSIMPVMSARSMLVPGPQIWLAGSAVDQETMSNGLVMARVRESAITGSNDRLAYFEYSADVRAWLEEHGRRFDPTQPEIEQITPEMLSDPEMWTQANPALDRRISRDHVLTEFRSPSLSARQFAIERLGIGDWPATDEEADRVISAAAWADCKEIDPANRITGVPVFAVDINPAQTWGAVAVAGKRADGQIQVAVVKHDRETDWIVDFCKELKAKHSGSKFVVHKNGPAGEKIDDLKAMKVRVIVASNEDYGLASAGFVTGVTERRLKYPFPQPELDEALAVARKQSMGDAWKWSRKDSASADISPLVAGTLAFWAAENQKRPRAINPNDFM